MRARTALLVLCLTACTPSEKAPAPAASTAAPRGPAPDTLVVASYNVLYSLASKQPGTEPAKWADHDTLSHIEQLEADVILFQETNAAWEAAIRAVVSKRLPHCTFRAPVRYLPEGLGVCSRHPVEDEVIPSPLSWFPAQRVRVHVPGGDVEMLNVHLRPAVAGPDRWWRVHEETRPLRKQEMDAYLPRLTPGLPAIVAGDFNDIHAGGVFRTLESAGFVSAFAQTGERGVTWRWAGLAEPLEAQLDHVTFTASAFELVSAKIVDGGRSDHVPIVITLRRRPPKT